MNGSVERIQAARTRRGPQDHRRDWATCYGPGGGLARLVQGIARDGRAVPTVPVPKLRVEGVTGLVQSPPRVVGAAGVMATVWQVPNADERAALCRSAEPLKAASAGVTP